MTIILPHMRRAVVIVLAAANVPFVNTKFLFSDPTLCTGSLLGSGFDIFDYANYDKWFTDDSIMELAQAGQFKGAEAIEEYVRFIDETSPYMADFLNFDQSIRDMHFNQETQECELLGTQTSVYRSDDSTVRSSTFAVSTLLRMYYKVPEQGSITVRKADVYFSDQFLSFYFETIYMRDRTSTYICSVMNQYCPDIWVLNDFLSIDDCSLRIKGLPQTEGGDVSGKSQGCKMIHAAFVPLNPTHCPHISIKPESDSSGVYKCQTALRGNTSDFFTPDDIEKFHEKNRKLGIGENGFKECNCGKEYKLWHPAFKKVNEFIQDKNTRPATWRYEPDPPFCAFCK